MMQYFIGGKVLALARVVAKTCYSLGLEQVERLSPVQERIIKYVGGRDKSVPIRRKDVLYYCTSVGRFPTIRVMLTILAMEKLDRHGLITLESRGEVDK